MFDSTLIDLAWIAAIAVGAHLATIAIRSLSRVILRSRVNSESKVVTITGFATSTIVFGIYFAAIGFMLSELGVSLTTYLASASVLGLAVSFGSQGIVQDVITGLTVVFSDLLDVGDMVELGGQVGIVEHVGMRFTVLVNFSGARVFVPNRSINNVINYPKGYIRAYLDARVPSVPSGDAPAATAPSAGASTSTDTTRPDRGEAWGSEVERRLDSIARAAYQQFPGILLMPPNLEGRFSTEAGYAFVRVKFRIWPGQGAVLEGAIKASVVQSMRALDPTYSDWMISVHYRSESHSDSERKRLPRPTPLHDKTRTGPS